MLVTFVKNVHNVDFGVFGKKSVNVDVRLKQEKGEWHVVCYYFYILGSDGKMTPIDKTVVGYEFITNVVNECLAEVKTIDKWKMN